MEDENMQNDQHLDKINDDKESNYSPEKTHSSINSNSNSSRPLEVNEKIAVKSTRKKIEQDIQLLK